MAVQTIHRGKRFRNVFSATVAGVVLLAGACTAAAGAPETALVPLAGHVLPALAHAQRLQVKDAAVDAANSPADPLSLTVVLRRTDAAGFAAYLADVYDPKSANFRKFLSPAQVTERFGPTQQDYDAVNAYFSERGLALVAGSANRMTLSVQGARADVERALGVTIADYQIGQKRFYANTTDPALPASIAARVEAVTGMTNLAVPQPQTQALKTVFCTLYAHVAATEPLTDKNGKVWAPSSKDLVDKLYRDCMIDQKADGYGTLTKADPPPPAWQGADGTGQVVGLLEFDTFQPSDVSDYIDIIGLPPATINQVTQVHVAGGAVAGPNQDEVLLDIDEVLSTAPGVSIKVFDGPFGGAGASFQGMFNAMINGGVNIISNSWAYCEDQTSLADVQSIDTILQTAAASGISVFTGSGDHGSTCLDGSANTVHVPADSPHVTAVGASSLNLGPGNIYGSETWWDGSTSTPPTGQGGYGTSVFFPRPAYQDGLTTSPARSVPDVVSNGDPAKGAQICQASAGGCPSGLLYGGTSKSAPSWAAFAALLNATQGSNLGFFNALVYPLAGSSSFHSAASMGSDFAHVGLGSPNLARMHQSFTSQTVGAVDATVSQVAAFMAGNAFVAPNVLGLPLPGISDGATQSFVVVRVADANGNIVSGKTITLAANPPGNVVIAPASGVSNANNGAVVFTLTNLTQETVTLTATDATDGIVLQDKPDIQFLVPPATAAGISATPTSVPPDQASTSTITVTLHDALGRPAPGKSVTLAQGTGHSVITAPNPAITDATGSIQFIAINGVSEIVTYTAVDVTDGNLAVPGSATVNFTGTATSCAGGVPTGGPGFTITPFATGFFAQNFLYGNVNWGGCPGASNPTFDPSGAVYVADFRTGDLFQMTLAGGVAATAKHLSSLGLTLGQPTLGKDGRLYASHGATTGNFFTGDIVEIDRTTGAQLRVVAANLTCPANLSIDPLSGDLFFDDQCFGAGSDNPSIWRIADPGNTAVLSVYATLPGSPNGGLAFSPDGTLYAVSSYTAATPQVMQIGGTNTSAPPAMSVVPNLSSTYSLTLAQAQSNGAARSFIVTDAAGVELVDITTTPYTTTLLATGAPIGSGVIGPDGCLYSAASNSIYKLTSTAGGCGFLPTNPAPTLALTPSIVSPGPAQGTLQTLTATFSNVVVPAGTRVQFVIAGANVQVKTATTDANGVATLTYAGAFAGTDTVTASGTVGATTLSSNPVTLTWAAGKHSTFLDLATSPSGGKQGTSVALRAALSDVSLKPAAQVTGAAITFTLGTRTCTAATNAAGVATCSVVPPASGSLTLQASYSGNAQYTAASAAQGFNVLAALASTVPGAPAIGVATPGDGSALVRFSPPTSDGGSPILTYSVTCTPVGGGTAVSATGGGSPIAVGGLANGVAYTCAVSATNAVGTGAASAPSNAVTPSATVVAVAQPIPLLTGWHIALLALLLAAVGMLAARAHRRTATC